MAFSGKRWGILVAAFAFLASSAWADWSAAPSSRFQLDPPPAEGSARYRSDFEQLLRFQRERTDEECELADHMAKPSLKRLFGGDDGVLGDGKIEDVKPLLDEVFEFAERVSDYHKGRFKRRRPYQTNPKVEPCIEGPMAAKSYPSGHATVGWVGACVLAKIFPKRAAELREQGQYIGELRVIAGVHHPSDIEAGRILGQQICDYLLSNRSFLKELEEYQE